MLFNRPVLIVAILTCLLPSNTACGEFPALASAFKDRLSELSKSLKGKTVLVAIDESSAVSNRWRLVSAIETEIVAQLLANEVQATDDDTDLRFDWVADSGFRGVARWRQEPVYDFLLLGQVIGKRNRLEVNLSVFSSKPDSDAVASTTLTVNQTQGSLEANIPQLNQQVLSYYLGQAPSAITSGNSWAVASSALKFAGARRKSIYRFGRRLSPGEAILPGDLIQFEQAVFRGRFHSKELKRQHSTAVVGNILGMNQVRTLRAVHRNNEPDPGVTIHLNELQRGSFAIFRPVADNSLLPMSVQPLRKTAIKAVTDAGKIDLLQSLDAQLDTVAGLWDTIDGQLTCHSDYFCRLQIPVEVPESYTIRGKIKRVEPGNAYVFVLVVGGRQVLLAIDGFKGDQTSGLGLIQGKKENANQTTYLGKVLPVGRDVEIEIVVTPNTITFVADKKTIINWSGQATDLSLPGGWTVPETNWLAVGCYRGKFTTSNLILEPANK